jgi:hypothetical protein
MRSRTCEFEPRRNGSPSRLIEEGDATARLLEEANLQYQDGIDEANAWRALRTERSRHRVRNRACRVLIPLSVGLALGASALGLVLPRAVRNQGAVIGSTSPGAAESTTGAVVKLGPIVPPSKTAQASVGKYYGERAASKTRRLTPTPARHALPEGHSILADGSEIRLSPRARADLHGTAGESTTIDLLAGAVELSVAPQHDRAFEVAVGGITFRVMGTRFSVTLRQHEPELAVSEGTVAVVDGGRVVARVTAGGGWRKSAPPAAQPMASVSYTLVKKPQPSAPTPTPAVEQARPMPPAPNADPCLAMARDGRGLDAIHCLRPLSSGVGLSAEMATYEIARLQRDVLGDVPAALATLQQYASRFPRGFLQTEVRLSQISLLARLGRTQEALAESGRLLSSAGGRERAAELHLLRGNLLREQAADCDNAIREYTSAEESRGPVGAEAALEHARCLESQGRLEEARTAYRACIERGQGRMASEARRRIDALDRR